MRLPSQDLPTPPGSELRPLPYDKGVLLHFETKTRWYKSNEGIIRDLTGEREWEDMGKYIGRTYEQMFIDAWLRTTTLT